MSARPKRTVQPTEKAQAQKLTKMQTDLKRHALVQARMEAKEKARKELPPPAAKGKSTATSTESESDSDADEDSDDDQDAAGPAEKPKKVPRQSAKTKYRLETGAIDLFRTDAELISSLSKGKGMSAKYLINYMLHNFSQPGPSTKVPFKNKVGRIDYAEFPHYDVDDLHPVVDSIDEH